MKAKPRSKLVPEHLRDANLLEDAEIRYLFEELVQAVSYMSYRHLSVEVFKDIRRLATYDQWTDADNLAKARWMSADPAELTRIRRRKEYKEIKTKLVAAFDALASPVSFRVHIEDHKTQDRIFRATKRAALYGSEKVANKAQESLIERVAPRAIPGQQQVVVQIRADHAALIARSLVESRERKVIDVTSSGHNDVHEGETGGAEGGGET